MKRLLQSVETGAFILAGCLCFSQALAPQDPFERLYVGSPLLIGKTRAWIVQEPRVISQGKVSRILFGAGANEAVVITVPRTTFTPKEALGEEREPPSSIEHRFSLVNLAAGSSRPVGQVQARNLDVNWASFGRLLHLSHDGGSSILDIQTGRIHPLPEDGLEFPVISRIPHIALLHLPPWDSRRDAESAKKAVKMRLFDFSTTPPRSEVITLPPLAAGAVCVTKEGILITPAEGIELKTGRIVAPSAADEEAFLFAEGLKRRILDFEEQGNGKGLTLVVRDDPDRRGAPSGSSSFSRSRITISEDARFGEISDSEEWVVFSAHGAGFAIQLTPIDLEAARKALLKHAKENALSFAKQAGTASAIYAADYDGFLPLSGSHARDALMPYLKNRDMLDSVVWTNMTGQNSDKLNDPAGTILGYVLGPGGRAVLYADTHVVWVPD